jgi:hypothetical protein
MRVSNGNEAAASKGSDSRVPAVLCPLLLE